MPKKKIYKPRKKKTVENKGTITKFKKSLNIEIEPTQVLPFTVKLDLEPNVVDRLIQKVVYETQSIESEMGQDNRSLQENDSVNYRFDTASRIYAYKVKYTNSPFPGAYNIPGIVVPTAVDGLRAGIVKSFKTDPPFQAVQEPNTEIAIAKEKWAQHHLRFGIRNSKENIISWLHTAILKGTSCIWYYERKINRIKRERVKYNSVEQFVSRHPASEENMKYIEKLQRGKKVTLVETVDKSQWEDVIEWFDPKTLRVHDVEKDLNNASFVGRIVKYTLEEFLDQDFDNIDLVVSDDDIKNMYKQDKEIETVHAVLDFITEDISGINQKSKKKKKFKKQKIFVVVDRETETLLYAIKYPEDNDHCWYIPMFIGPFEGYFWRQGFYDKLKGIHMTHKETLDLILNAAKITYIPSFKAKKTGGFDPLIQDWYPGVVWWLDKYDDVVQWDIRPSSMPLERILPLLQQYSYEGSGISPYNQGSPTSSGESGKKIGLLLQAGSLRTEEITEHMRESFNELVFQMFDRAKKRIHDKQQIFINQEVIDIEPEIFSLGSNNAYMSTLDFQNSDPEVIHKRDIEVLQIESANPQVINNPDANRALHAQYLRSARYGWENRVNDVLPTKEQLRQKQVDITKDAIIQLMEEQQVENIGRNVARKVHTGQKKLNLTQTLPGL